MLLSQIQKEISLEEMRFLWKKYPCQLSSGKQKISLLAPFFVID